jgi:bifunctional non-homologous end joining protein LigD
MVYSRLKPLITYKCPFVNLPETGRARWGEILDVEKMKKCMWVRPKLVAVIEFLEWTEGDRLRHSKFVARRDDRNPKDVVKEAQAARWTSPKSTR